MTDPNGRFKPVSPMRHLLLALRCGLFTGLGVGHVDLLVRVLEKRIEWFEVYLSLLLPALVLGGAFTLTAAVLEAVFAVKGSGPSREQLERSYHFFGIGIFLLVVLFPAAHTLRYGDLLMWEPARTEFNAGLFFVAVLAIMGLQLLTNRWRPGRVALAVQAGFADYCVFLMFLCVSCLIYDIYLLKTQARVGPPAKTAKAPPTGRPNVILITLDTVRARNVSFHGYEKQTTPNLDRWAERAAVFDKMESVTSWTLPAHASLFTGRYSHNHQAHEMHQQLKSDEVTLAEILLEEGYRTAGFVGGPYAKAKYGLSQGFELYSDRLDFFEYRHTYDPLSIKRLLDFASNDLRWFLLRNDGERTAPEINREVFRWLESVRGQPYFLFVNYFDAHDPYNQGLEYRKQFTSEQRDDDAINHMVRSYYFEPVARYQIRNIDPDLREYLIAMYDTEIFFLDKQVEALLTRIRELGMMENTILIVTSDHGEEFFEHGGVMHKQTLYEEVLHVPFFLHFPDRISPARISSRTSLVDVVPTVLELLGLPEKDDVDGVNLLSLLEPGVESPDRSVIAERYARPEHGESRLNAIIGQDWKYIEANPEKERMPTSLYHLGQDPLELENLLQKDPERAQRMAEELRRAIGGE